jgi:hypothetical protein
VGCKVGGALVQFFGWCTCSGPRVQAGAEAEDQSARHALHQGVQEYVAHPRLSENTKNRYFRDYNLLIYYKSLFIDFPPYSTRSLQRYSISIIRARISSIIILFYSFYKIALSSLIFLQVLLCTLSLIIF